MSNKRGPRTTGEDTRRSIVVAAQTEFAHHGYDHASLRAIARAAGVDPALVHHYFASKSELFIRSLAEMPPHPLEIAQQVLTEPADRAAEALLRNFFQEWDTQGGQMRFLATFRSMAHPEGLRQIRRFWRCGIIDPVVQHFTDDQVDLRSSLLAAELVGIAVMRYVIRAPGIADAPADQLVAAAAPCTHRYLLEPLGVPVG